MLLTASVRGELIAVSDYFPAVSCGQGGEFGPYENSETTLQMILRN